MESWLNSEANINVNISSFEKEFSNGYYLGKILFNYGLLPKFFDFFHNKPMPVYRETNYELLAPALKQLNIEFDSNLQKALRKEELGVAKKLVFKYTGLI